MTVDKLKTYLTTTIIFTNSDAAKVAEAMGAVFKYTTSESKQGGGATMADPKWPDGTIVQLSEMLTIEGTLRMFNEWHVYAALSMQPKQSGPTFIATVEGEALIGRDACAVLWAVILSTGIKPHAYVGFRATKPLSPDMRGDTAPAAEPGEPTGDRAVDSEADTADRVQEEQVPAGQDTNQRPVAVDNDVPGLTSNLT